MSELRWIIALIGIGVIAALFIWGRHRSESRRRRAGRVEPQLDEKPDRQFDSPELRISAREEDWVQFPETEIRRQPDRAGARSAGASSTARESAAAGPDRRKIVVLHVRAASGADFKGAELLEVFKGEGLEFGKYGAFHQLDDKGRSQFVIANMMEPGSFPIDSMASFSTSGITAFMVLPGPAGVDGLARMIACCRRLATILGGEVLDESRSTLTNQRATHLKEEIIEFLRQSRLDPSGLGPDSD